ncbi:hypothetical protein [Methanobrevibacter gottschalkii]
MDCDKMVRNKRLNAVISFILPGLGQILNGDEKRGIKFLIGMVVLHIVIYYALNNVVGSMISTLYHAYSAYDAYKTCEM